MGFCYWPLIFVWEACLLSYTFKRVRKIVCLCLSAWNTSVPAGRIFFLNFIFEYFSKLFVKIQVALNLTRITDTSHEDQHMLQSYLAHFSLEWEIFQAKFVEKIKTHFLYSIFFFFKSCRVWDNVKKKVEPERPQMTVRRVRVRVAC